MKEFFGKLWASITACPTSLGDYVGVGRWLIYKKFLVVVSVIAVLAVGVLIWWLARGSEPEKPFEIPVFYYYEDRLKVFSGEAILLNEADEVVYRGQISAGLRNGRGKELSSPDETVVYDGDFLGGFYSGRGKLYHYGILLYEGDFVNGLYDGSGRVYKGDKLLYDGQFVEGKYRGDGILYDGSKTLYEGEFLNGLYDGAGVLYEKGGMALYTGGFSKGKYSGSGILTTPDGDTIYEGGFLNGLYEGEGSLYSDGGVRLLLKGVFLKGNFDRNGSIYNTQGQLLYSGNIYGGGVDYIGLLGLSAVAVLEQVKELPIIYYSDGCVGYLYRELGFAAVMRYDYAKVSGIVPNEEATEEAISANSSELFWSRSDNLVINTLLIEGARLYEQVPMKKGTSVRKAKLTGFEAFMESRLGGDDNYAYLGALAAQVLQRGDHLYEITGLSEEVDYNGVGFFQSDVYYYYRKEMVDKDGFPGVIISEKAKYGG